MTEMGTLFIQLYQAIFIIADRDGNITYAGMYSENVLGCSIPSTDYIQGTLSLNNTSYRYPVLASGQGGQDGVSISLIYYFICSTTVQNVMSLYSTFPTRSHYPAHGGGGVYTSDPKYCRDAANQTIEDFSRISLQFPCFLYNGNMPISGVFDSTNYTNAWMPVIARPKINEWISDVPS